MIEIDYYECRDCGFALDADVFEEVPICPRGCEEGMKRIAGESQ